MNNELDNQKRVSLSGSNITHIISRVSLFFGLFPLLALIEGIRLGEDLAPFFRDVGPFILFFLLVSYVSYSYRMVVERESGSGMVLFSRQILHPSIRFRKREFVIDQLEVKQVTMGGGQGSGATDYTTVVVDGKDFFTYIGKKKKILKAIPELKRELPSHPARVALRKAKMESNEWISVVPDEAERFRNDTRRMTTAGIGMVALGTLLVWWNGDRSLEDPLGLETYMVIAGVGLLALSMLIMTQYKEVRWIAEERTILIVNRGIFGRLFVELVYEVMEGDSLVLDEETQTHYGTDSDGNPTTRTETTYWLSIRRQGGEPVRTTLGSDVVEGSKGQLERIRNFIQSQT